MEHLSISHGCLYICENLFVGLFHLYYLLCWSMCFLWWKNHKSSTIAITSIVILISSWLKWSYSLGLPLFYIISNWVFLLHLLLNWLTFCLYPGGWTLHLWSDGSLCCHFHILESVWGTHFASCFISRKLSFTGFAACLQCSGIFQFKCFPWITLSHAYDDDWALSSLSVFFLHLNDFRSDL